MPRSRPRPARSTAPAAGLAAGLAALLLAPLTPAAAQTAPPPTAGTTASPSASATPTATPSATASATPTATTSPTPAPSSPVLRMGISTNLVRGAGSLVVTGRMYRAPNAPAQGVALDVLGRTPGATGWARLGRMTTDDSGLAQLRLVPRVSREYAVRTATAPVLMTDPRRVEVQPLLSASLAPRLTQAGRAGVVTGRLVPAYSGTKVLLQRRSGAGWSTLTSAAPDAAGAFRLGLAGDPLGRHVYRVHLRASASHRAATSAPMERVVEGRSLRSGDRGPDVLSLQQRLAEQKVDVGAIDGVYGYDLLHAVTAFQKSQGLPRTGVYDKTTSARLAAPRAVVLRHPSAGRAVEVDITKQVLYLSEGGRLTRIVDVSTGNDELYESEGVTYRAFTPTGRFSVQRKIDGVRVSRLGELYRPAYFVRGWAIHGSPNVPVYPDSHGCVRVTNGAMDRMFRLLTIGTPVSVYRS